MPKVRPFDPPPQTPSSRWCWKPPRLEKNRQKTKPLVRRGYWDRLSSGLKQFFSSIACFSCTITAQVLSMYRQFLLPIFFWGLNLENIFNQHNSLTSPPPLFAFDSSWGSALVHHFSLTFSLLPHSFFWGTILMRGVHMRPRQSTTQAFQIPFMGGLGSEKNR